MDIEFWTMFFKIIIFLPFILFLIYLSLKYGGTKLQGLQGGKYLKMVERLSISKDNSIMVVKIGVKGYVISSTNNKIELLEEITAEELAVLESNNSMPQYTSLKDFIDKLKHKKED